MFFNELNSIKIKKILQILRTLNINVQLFSLNQFNKNAFKLTIINSHLIVNTSFAFILLQEETRIDHLFRVLVFILFLHFFVKDSSIAINIRNRCFHELDYRSFAITRKLNSSFFHSDFILIAQFFKTLKKLDDVMFIEV